MSFDSERLRPKVLALKIQDMGLDFHIKGPKNEEGIKFKDVGDELMEYILYKCKRCESDWQKRQRKTILWDSL